MTFASSKQSAGEGKRKYAKYMAFQKLYSHRVLAAIGTVRLGFAFYMITDNDLKAESLISHTCDWIGTLRIMNIIQY